VTHRAEFPCLKVAFRGDRLRQLRHVRNIPARQVAHKVGITTYHVYRLERGERPRAWGITVAKLALALGTSTDYLLNLTDDSAPAKKPMKRL